MVNQIIKSIFETPLKFIDSVIGSKKIQLEENVHMFKLGKQCTQCKKSIVHRDAISICQCYCFTHKDCLRNQLKNINMSECTSIYCKSCQKHVNITLDFDYYLEPKCTMKDLIVLFFYIALCGLSMAYLISYQNNKKAAYSSIQQLRAHHNQNKSQFLSVQQVIALTVIFIFGTLFWLSILGILIKKKSIIRQIGSTNIQIKVSAFQQIQCKIREQSQQEIILKKQQQDL